jgi:hypothetical protein
MLRAMGLRVGWDWDDVIEPWFWRAHELVKRAGKDNDVVPKSWVSYEEYGLARDDWLAILSDHKAIDYLYGGRPFKGVKAAMKQVKDAGHDNIVVTTRGHFHNGPQVKRYTREHIDRYSLPVDACHFVVDKTTVRLDTMLDDNVKNFVALMAAGVDVYLQDQEWNRDLTTDRRVEDAQEYVDRILGSGRVGT